MGYNFANDNFVIFRTIGNELEPRDKKGSKLKALEYILENEPRNLCAKRWLINHIIDLEYKTKIIDLLDRHQQFYNQLLFRPDKYSRLKTFRDKVRYGINVNNARNVGVKQCQQDFKFVICLDQDCFFTEKLLLSIIDSVTADQEINSRRQYYGILMKRATNEYFEHIEDLPDQEPHLIFRQDAREYFDESLPFGQNDKIDLLKKVGYNSLNIVGEKCKNAGFVIHHSYGNEEAENSLRTRMYLRKLSLNKFIEKLDVI